MALTDQLDLFVVEPAADVFGYNCVALAQTKENYTERDFHCCSWCHREGTMYSVPIGDVLYRSCCDHIYGGAIRREDDVLLKDNPNGLGYDDP